MQNICQSKMLLVKALHQRVNSNVSLSNEGPFAQNVRFDISINQYFSRKSNFLQFQRKIGWDNFIFKCLVTALCTPCNFHGKLPHCYHIISPIFFFNPLYLQQQNQVNQIDIQLMSQKLMSGLQDGRRKENHSKIIKSQS